jgi:hypothetical protein
MWLKIGSSTLLAPSSSSKGGPMKVSCVRAVVRRGESEGESEDTVVEVLCGEVRVR